MNTRPYTDLLGLVEALCGATLAEQERVRIRYFVNRRAQRAYAATELWPRFLVVGEERVVSEAGLLPYEQPALADIGTVLRIHATRPFLADPAREYGEFYAATAGIQITGYEAAESTSIRVTSFSSIFPAAPVLYLRSTTESIAGRFNYYYAGNQNGQVYPYGNLSWDPESPRWNLDFFTDSNTFNAWQSPDDVSDPVDVTSGIFLDENVFEDPTATLDHPYSAFITYKAALTATYGSNDGDTTTFPEEWFEYAAHGAYADFLRNEGQQDKALVAEAEATEILQEQLEKVSRQGGARVATRVMNHANHQSR